MNDNYLEVRLLAARPSSQDVSGFTEQVMGQIRRKRILDKLTSSKTKRRMLLELRYKKALLVLAISLGVFVAGVSGYAYASGTNPVSLIRRWIVGNTVKAQYQGRTYQYGKGQNYSDAAISAFAEVENVQLMDFQQENNFAIPHDGAQFFTPPHYTYIDPWIGTLEKADATSLYIRQQLMVPDGVDKGMASGALVAIPRSSMWFYEQGKRLIGADLTSADLGKSIYVAETPFLRHVPGSKQVPTEANQYFVYTLVHNLPDLQAAERDTAADKTQVLHDPTEGAASDRCFNNAVDTCSQDISKEGKGQDLYAHAAPYNGSVGGNPNCAPFGEGDPSGVSDNLLLRDLEGRIVSIDNNGFTIRTSSGAYWTLAYAQPLQQTFAHSSRPLRAGDDIGGAVLSPLTDLDNRQIPDSHIYDLRRL